MNVQEDTELYYCETCRHEVKGFHRYCHHCGDYLGFDAVRVNLFKNANLQSAFTFFSIYLFVCLTVHLTNLFDGYSQLFWVEIFLAVITLCYVRLNYTALKPALQFKSFTVLRTIGCIALAAVASIIINIVVSKMNISFFGTDGSYYSRYSIYMMPAVVMIYSIALNPAVFEELAFRGVIYNYLNNILDERVVVIITAFMFAIVHMNFISLFWLVPFGLLVGLMRKRFGTVWYGVIFHFTFNLVAVIFDLYKNGYF